MPSANAATFARHAQLAAGFNTALALAITVSGFAGFVPKLLYSQLIGMSIWALVDGGKLLLQRRGWDSAATSTLLVLAGALLGYLGGSAAGDLLLGHPPLHAVHQYSQAATGFLLISLASAAFGAYFFTSREQLARPWLAHAQAQRQASEARLMLLQSQLEPHMLFNTLANLRALLGRDPQRACDMLDHLVAYLRATLSASRTDLHPLQTEFSRLRDYLALMAVRMGPRLQVTLDLPEALAALPVPPPLLQPLVENALVLGLEPKVQGGHMTVPAQHQDGQLTLTVSDIGLGLGPGANPPEGFGLTQVRERLQTIFGAFGRHEMIANYAGGTAATVVFLCKMK